MKDSIGALWSKVSKEGKAYFTGIINRADGSMLDIVIFPNDKGDNPKRPDYRIFPSEPR